MSNLLYTFIFLIYIVRPINVPSKNNIVALVLARGGSKGIYQKNLSIVQNQTLIARTIETLIKFGKFKSVWVSTDDKYIATESKKAGSLVYRRYNKYATDDAPSIHAIQEFVFQQADIDVIALVQCTSPFLKIEDLEKAYEMIVKDGFDSVFSVTRNYKLLWKIKSDGYIFPFNFNSAHRPRRQEKFDEFIETGMFYFAKSFLIKQGVLQGGKIGFVEVPKERALEIDTVYDLHIAQVLSSFMA